MKLMYPETGAFSSEFLSRMLSQWANQYCINKQILKSYQRYPDVLAKYDRNYNELLQELKIFKIIMTKSVLFVYKFCDEKNSDHCLKFFLCRNFRL